MLEIHDRLRAVLEMFIAEAWKLRFRFGFSCCRVISRQSRTIWAGPTCGRWKYMFTASWKVRSVAPGPRCRTSADST